ncbi:MAG: hypothetical protein WA161_07600, partial [Pseudomonas sp.]
MRLDRRSRRLLPRLFLALLLALLALSAWQWRAGPPLQASMLALLPQGAGDELVQQAERRMQEPLNRELLVLVGHAERKQAIVLVQRIARQWAEAERFEQLQWSLQADLDALRQQVRSSRLSLLPSADRQLLITQPKGFIQQRAAQLFDTFASVSLLPIDQDWLGLGARAQQALNPHPRIQTDLASGALLVEDQGLTWALLRARIRGDSFDLQAAPAVASEVA